MITEALTVHVTPMRRRHVRSVLRIEEQVYPRPWSMSLFLSELALRTTRAYFVARVGREVVGYAGLMMTAEDGHVTTIAVDPKWHRHKIGTRLLLGLAREAIARGAENLTLEVRLSNKGAQDLYRRFGFSPVGVRKGYYQETNEDALVMWVHEVNTPEYAELLAGLERVSPARPISRNRADGDRADDASLMRILGIETSCDETAAAVVEDGRRILSSVVSSQIELHAQYGGVVPEVASRAHVELVNPVIADALGEAGVELTDLDAIAACHGPGLAGALLVGVSAAKALALVTGLPYVQVNHLEAHLYAGWLEDPELRAPLAVLLASGGHTLLVVIRGHGDYEVLGQTVDDAAGEAFDKVARYLGLGYPGGPAIDLLARRGDPAAYAFPRAMAAERDFSFSGLKTAVVTFVRKHPDAPLADVAASFQEAAVDQLVSKLVAAADDHGAPTLVLAGGVAANSRLRARVADAAAASGRSAFLPPPALCTDNAAMIAATAFWRLGADGPTPLHAGVAPNAGLAGLAS